MRYLYKIWSNYDGFTPKRISERLVNGGQSLVLGWERYLDVVDLGEEVWVYFHGSHRFENGVYVEGRIEAIDPARRRVTLKIDASSTTDPLTDPALSFRIAQIVAPHYRQVFLLPLEIAAAPTCTVTTDLSSCVSHLCGACDVWNTWPTVRPADLVRPHRLSSALADFVPAFWTVPRRSFLFHHGGSVNRRTQLLGEQFTRFKLGEELLAYPFALGMYEALIHAGRVKFDAIVPIPLSPDKASAGEYHRTLGLAKELSSMIDAPVVEALTLRKAISKKQRRTRDGLSPAAFESEYRLALEVTPDLLDGTTLVLLVDDACTEGSTLRSASQALHRSGVPPQHIVAATAVQMAVKAVVADEAELR